MRFITSYGLAFLILLGIGAWMVSGTLIEGGQGRDSGERPLIDAIEGEEGPLRPLLESLGILQPLPEEEAGIALAQAEIEPQRQLVRVATFEAQAMPQRVSLRGRTKANATIASRAETSGIVEAVHFSRGQTVAPGDLLCTLDRGTREAQLATAEAQLEQASADLDNNVQLRERGVAPANTARQFEVALRSAQAVYDNALAELDRTEIHAEVAGIVQMPHANVGDSLSAGTECATIVQLDPMLFVGQIAEARVGLVHEGEAATVSTVTGHEVEGEVRFVSSVADPATRAFDIEIALDNADRAIRDGVTAQAVIEVGEIDAHLVPQSVLTLDDDGVLGVRAVEDGKVVFHPVEIIQDTREGVWVTGLSGTLDIITLGQEFVTAGEPVSVGRAGEPAS